MKKTPQYIKETEGGIEVRVYVCPRSSKNAFQGEHAGAVKVRLTSPPVDGAANAALIEFIAKTCAVAKSNVGIKSGSASRHKTVYVRDVTPEDFISAVKAEEN